MLSEFLGSMTMRPMRPVSFRPMFFHVLPPSGDWYTPSPVTSISRIAHASPVPAHTMLGELGATARAPIAATSWSSKMGRQFDPPSVDFQMPPEDAPAYHVFGSPGTPDTAATRLPAAGPRKRKLKPSPPPPPRRLCPFATGVSATSASTTQTAAA